ncbi:Rab11 [Hexamita inflata]|uniref:Rab11 n=1 Tax=Hexamita inflata TaxID=28002 RepID=A0AA86TD91_9EUKA|nr:Rab11 [Hexamita inflata]
MADEIKVVIIGDTGVGKTCIATRLIANTFNPQSPSTLSAAFLRKQMNNHQLQIWDTAGQERFRSIAPLYYRNAYAVILVFDITRKISFESLQFWLNDLSSKFQNQQKPLITFVGNKSDLQDQREVSVEQVEQLCQESTVVSEPTLILTNVYVIIALENQITVFMLIITYSINSAVHFFFTSSFK